MRFSTVAACFVAATGTMAAPLDGNAVVVTRETTETAQLEARVIDPVTLSILTAAAGAAGSWATTQALNAIKDLVSSAASWDDAREAFTKATVDKMMANIKVDASFVGAVCYNMGYDINDKSLISAVTSVDFKSGSLKTDYDCFYTKKGAKFTGKGDGGFINLATNSVNSACKFDSGSKTFTC